MRLKQDDTRQSRQQGKPKQNNKQHQYDSPFQEERSPLKLVALSNMEAMFVTLPTDQRRVTEIRGEM
jgi:hypothetical protein